jgi:hypothetical protein
MKQKALHEILNPVPGELIPQIFLNGWRPYAWIGLLTAALYLRTVGFGFTSLDDVHLIVLNQEHLKDWRSIVLAFKTDILPAPVEPVLHDRRRLGRG